MMKMMMLLRMVIHTAILSDSGGVESDTVPVWVKP